MVDQDSLSSEEESEARAHDDPMNIEEQKVDYDNKDVYTCEEVINIVLDYNFFSRHLIFLRLEKILGVVCNHDCDEKKPVHHVPPELTLRFALHLQFQLHDFPISVVFFVVVWWNYLQTFFVFLYSGQVLEHENCEHLSGYNTNFDHFSSDINLWKKNCPYKWW